MVRYIVGLAMFIALIFAVSFIYICYSYRLYERRSVDSGLLLEDIEFFVKQSHGGNCVGPRIFSDIRDDDKILSQCVSKMKTAGSFYQDSSDPWDGKVNAFYLCSHGGKEIVLDLEARRSDFFIGCRYQERAGDLKAQMEAMPGAGFYDEKPRIFELFDYLQIDRSSN